MTTSQPRAAARSDAGSVTSPWADTSSAQPTRSTGAPRSSKFTDPGWATVNLALSALAELEAEITGRLGEPAVRQLRSTLLRILDRPAYTRREGSSGPSA